MADLWERTMPCKDALGRDRVLRVFIAHDDDGKIRIGFHVPAGEVGKLEPQALSKLHDILAAAGLEAAHRGAVWG